MMKLFVAAVFATIVAFPAGAVAAQTWEDVSIQTAIADLASAPVGTLRGTLLYVPAPAHPNVVPSFFVNYVASGPSISGLPCFNCVPTAGNADNIGMPISYNDVPPGVSQQYNISWTNFLPGSQAVCKIGLSITSGKTVIQHAVLKRIALGGPGGFDWGFDLPRPVFTGAAIATGAVTCGGVTRYGRTTVYYE